ncbi:MAG: hypothetical protein ACKVIJ_07435, partial [Flavobacteriales bacterium]
MSSPSVRASISPLPSISARLPKIATRASMSTDSVYKASEAMVPVTKALPSSPNIPRRRRSPSVRASYRSLPSRSIEPEGIVPARNSSRAVTPSLSWSLVASEGSFGSS